MSRLLKLVNTLLDFSRIEAGIGIAADKLPHVFDVRLPLSVQES